MKNTKNVKDTNAKVTATETKATKTKPTKTSLVSSLRAIAPQVAKVSTDLALKIDKALKNKKTTVEDMTALLKEAIELGNKPVVEADAKPAPKKKVTAKKTEKADEKSTKTEKAEKKKTEKKSEESPIKSLKTTGNLKAPMATLFPDTITTENEEGTLTLTKVKPTEFTKMEEIVDALENGKTVLFACYWSKRHIKEYNYSYVYRVDAPKSFENDLDLVLAVADCKKVKRVWAMSLYTDAMFFFEESDLEPIEDENPYTGEKYLIRVSNGMEFDIYIADTQ